MEEEGHNETEDLKLESLESVEEENKQDKMETENIPSSFQQEEFQEPEKSSFNDLTKISNEDLHPETKLKLLSNSGEAETKSNSGSITTNLADNFVKTDDLSLGVREESHKHMASQDESTANKVKITLSNISRNTEIITESNSNKMNNSLNVNSIVRIKDSSSSTENSVQTYSSTEDDEQNVVEDYKVFPKSVPSSVNVNPNLLTVKFSCANVSFLSAFDMTTTVEEIKKRLCYILELEEEFLIFNHNGIETKDSQTLADLGDQPNSQVLFEMFSKKGDEGNKLLKAKITENIPTIDIISVHLDYRDVAIEIKNESVQKQWLGGFRNRLTDKVYHNAHTQTIKKKKIFEIDEVTGEKIGLFFSRDTQTPFPLEEKTVSTVVDKATQSTRSDLYISFKNDKILSSQNYFKHGDVSPLADKHLLKCIVTVQRAVRKSILRQKFISLINKEREGLKVFKDNHQLLLQDQETKDRAVITGTVHPVNRDDFYALFLRVEKWWKKEWKKICKTKRSESKKAASVMLVEDETKLLRAIEKHKAASKAESLKKQEMHFLDKISRPVMFRTSSGYLTTIDYVETQKAREFKEIYSALIRKDVLPKDRVEILITMKKLFESNFKEYEYAKDLVSLINREVQLIGMGLKLKDLKGLQRRIEQLFLNFMHQPEFNPSAKAYKKPNLPKTVHKTYQCSRCLKLLPASGFPVHVRMRALDQCKSCVWMQNIAHKRDDMSPYLKLLHKVQNSEMQKCCYSAICFIFQQTGMAFLTKIIWHGHSAISGCTDISKLQHVRWLPDVEWAPWNTILLTDQEAKLHESIPDIFTFYDKSFIERVRQQHILARKDFIQLLMMDHDIRSSGQWSKITDSGDFLHPSHAMRIANENSEFDVI